MDLLLFSVNCCTLVSSDGSMNGRELMVDCDDQIIDGTAHCTDIGAAGHEPDVTAKNGVDHIVTTPSAEDGLQLYT